ncbi:hypothetical protein PC118_g20696 [Phytophthora cactorum]|uniref:Uncharacterized protein n=1 Tax=Phytophthora cactorum TaxID=29920 RepID=A0A8T1F514_9STRA|nr:hypothetical protein PC112_g20846 [Phytophthora cactorum]KAG2963788.1 hypothetical protein PC118_g20696 [Phytophthora cactorum]
MTESALIVTQAKDGVESGGRDRVQDVTWEAGVNASEEKATATDPVVLRNVCVGLEEKDVEVPEEFGLGAGKSVPLQWRSVELEGIGETGAYRKLPPLCDKDEPEGIAESGLRYYLQNEGCTDNEVERVVESARRYYEMEALAVRAKVRERRQRREEMTDQGNRRALGTVTFQGAEESVFELYTAGEESEGKPQFSRSEVDEIISSATVSRPAPEDKELAKKEKALQASKEEELGADFSD